jgi:hypothetical protein
MEYMGDDESRCGGWTRTGILELLQSAGGISKFMSKLAKLKKASLPWAQCPLEWQVWTLWYDQAVLTVRKRVVQALTTTGGGAVDSDDEDGGEGQALDESTSNPRAMKSMQRLVAEQVNEIEELRASLAQAQRTVTSQGNNCCCCCE